MKAVPGHNSLLPPHPSQAKTHKAIPQYAVFRTSATGRVGSSLVFKPAKRTNHHPLFHNSSAAAFHLPERKKKAPASRTLTPPSVAFHGAPALSHRPVAAGRRERFRGAGGGGGGAAAPARTITMYIGGFTVDDGPFRRLDDPANKDFLKDLANGCVPLRA